MLLQVLVIASYISTALAGQKDIPLVHPGALHTLNDIQRVKSHVQGSGPTLVPSLGPSLIQQSRPNILDPNPQPILVRGSNATYTPPVPESYQHAYRDAHAAYQLALCWLISGNTSYADHAVHILDSWAAELHDIAGTENMFLAAGLYGYQFANAAELLRVYSGWTVENQRLFGNMLINVFAPYNTAFLETHNNKPDFYYANWDLCNIASLMAIGIFTDNRTMLHGAVEYWKHGLPGSSGTVVNGALPYFSIANFTEPASGKRLMQIQESGRDQGHATLCIALLGVIGQQGWNQGMDLFSTYGNQILNAAEYVAKYNTNHTVPYKPYTSWEGLLPAISPDDRSTVRPGYESIVSHYAGRRAMDASWSRAYRDFVGRNTEAGVGGGRGRLWV